MPSLPTFLLFCGAALAIVLVPGPAVLYIVARSIEHGRRAGLVSVLGIASGCLVHVAAAAVGLSALLVSSALAFTVVKYAGAAYLVVLGVRRWRSRAATIPTGTPADLGRLYRQGVIVNILNPKTALFFLAFLPQFVAVERGHVPVQVVLLGLTFIAIGMMSDGTYAMAAASLGRWLKGSPRAMRAEPIVSGTVYVGLGVAAAFSSGGVAQAKA